MLLKWSSFVQKIFEEFWISTLMSFSKLTAKKKKGLFSLLKTITNVFSLQFIFPYLANFSRVENGKILCLAIIRMITGRNWHHSSDSQLNMKTMIVTQTQTKASASYISHGCSKHVSRVQFSQKPAGCLPR